MNNRFQRTRWQHLFFANILLLWCCMGCSDPTAPYDPNARVIPSSGSYFISSYDEVTAADSVVGHLHNDTVRVTDRGLSILGKTDVIATIASGDSITKYYHYDSNGDLSMTYEPLKVWIVYPFGSHDTTNENNPLLAQNHIYEGEDTLTIKGKRVPVSVTLTTITERDGSTVTSEEFYAHSLGWIVKRELSDGFTDTRSLLFDYAIH